LRSRPRFFFNLPMRSLMREHDLRSIRIGISGMQRSSSFAGVGLCGLAIIAPIYVYGGEMLIRVLLFSLPLLALLLVHANSRALSAAVVLLLSVAAPVHLIAHYGNEAYDYVSPAEVDGFHF